MNYGTSNVDAAGQQQGSHAYWNGAGTWGLGANFGAGFMNGPAGKPGEQMNVNMGEIHGGAGVGFEDASGQTAIGAQGEFNGMKFGMEPGKGVSDWFGWELGVMNANAGVMANESTAGFGLGASPINAAATFGNQENSLRLGASAGPGFGGRIHYGDADKDGEREAGFGFDAGPVSFDVKSELLGLVLGGMNLDELGQ